MRSLWLIAALLVMSRVSVAQRETVSFERFGAAPGIYAFGAPKETAPPEPPACPAKFDDSLETNGIAGDFRHGVTPPKATVSPAAELSERARKEAHKRHFLNAVSVLSMIVGEDGVPRNVCLKQGAGYDLDAQAAKAALKYRFEPATKDGDPVAARITMEVNFRAY